MVGTGGAGDVGTGGGRVIGTCRGTVGAIVGTCIGVIPGAGGGTEGTGGGLDKFPRLARNSGDFVSSSSPLFKCVLWSSGRGGGGTDGAAGCCLCRACE